MGKGLDQLSLFGAAPALPEGLVYRPDFLDPREEAQLAAWIATLPLKAFEFQGFFGKRRVHSFGWRYAFDGGGLMQADPMPDELLAVRARAAAFAGLAPETLEHVLLTEYADGAGIGWHRDRPAFGDVIGISLLAPARLRFRRRRGAGWERATLEAEPRSAYLLRGAARTEWEHGIAEHPALRYAITFRTLREGARPNKGPQL